MNLQLRLLLSSHVSQPYLCVPLTRFAGSVWGVSEWFESRVPDQEISGTIVTRYLDISRVNNRPTSHIDPVPQQLVSGDHQPQASLGPVTRCLFGVAC